jgi:hypothetical protein
MKKKMKLISFLLIVSLVIGTASNLVMAASSDFTSKSVFITSYGIQITWKLSSTANVDGIEVYGVDRDDKEILLKSLSATATSYELTDETEITKYKTFKVVCYRLENGEKVYGTPMEINNSAFEEYQLSDGITGISYPTKSQIRKMWKELSPTSKADKFSTKPTNKKPYKKGTVANSTLTNGLNTLNFVRYVAGISSNVKIKKSYQSLAQAAAVVNYNDKTATISHFPAQPAGMSDSLYEQGVEGSMQSNLAAGYSNLYKAILGWMSDSDSYNVDRVGHRRWCLNPSLKYTGFGIDGSVYSMYAFDESGDADGVHGVAWPAKNTPLNLFDSSDAWSISMGVAVPTDGTKVVLTRKSDNKKWTFTTKKSKINGNYMTINNDGYGQTGCIIFRPKNITYKKGDSFTVKVSGTGFSFSYDVTFFKL